MWFGQTPIWWISRLGAVCGLMAAALVVPALVGIVPWWAPLVLGALFVLAFACLVLAVVGEMGDGS